MGTLALGALDHKVGWEHCTVANWNPSSEPLNLLNGAQWPPWSGPVPRGHRPGLWDGIDRRPHHCGRYRDTGLPSGGLCTTAQSFPTRSRPPKCVSPACRQPPPNSPRAHRPALAGGESQGAQPRLHPGCPPAAVRITIPRPPGCSPTCAPQYPRLCISGGGLDPEVSPGGAEGLERSARGGPEGVPGLQRCH